MFQSFLKKCLDRKVEIVVKGESTKLTLRPKFAGEMPSPSVLSSFRLRGVVYGSHRLLASSDVSRVKVTRKDPVSGQPQEMLFNLETQNDFWLRDGDVIEVPEK